MKYGQVSALSPDVLKEIKDHFDAERTVLLWDCDDIGSLAVRYANQNESLIESVKINKKDGTHFFILNKVRKWETESYNGELISIGINGDNVYAQDHQDMLSQIKTTHNKKEYLKYQWLKKFTPES